MNREGHKEYSLTKQLYNRITVDILNALPQYDRKLRSRKIGNGWFKSPRLSLNLTLTVVDGMSKNKTSEQCFKNKFFLIRCSFLLFLLMPSRAVNAVIL